MQALAQSEISQLPENEGARDQITLVRQFAVLLEVKAALIIVSSRERAAGSVFIRSVRTYFSATYRVLCFADEPAADLLTQIGAQLELADDTRDRAQLTAKVLKQLQTSPGLTLLLCQGAENYGEADFELLRQINNLGKLIAIALCGNKRLSARLKHKKFRALTQRITAQMVLPASSATVADNAQRFRPDLSLARWAGQSRQYLGIGFGMTVLVVSMIIVFEHPVTSDRSLHPVAPLRAARLAMPGLTYPSLPDAVRETALISGERWLSAQADTAFTMQRAVALDPASLIAAAGADAHVVALYREGQVFYGLYENSFSAAQSGLTPATNPALPPPHLVQIGEVKREHTPR